MTRSLRTTFDGDCNDMLSKYSPFQSAIVTGVAVGGAVVAVGGTGGGVALAGMVGVGLGVAVGQGSGLAVMLAVTTGVAVGMIGVSHRVGSEVALITGVRVIVGLAGVKNLKRRYANTHKSTARTATKIHRILNRFTLQDLLPATAWG
ncbi:MAG: hypothetical protein JXM73_00530 [Anaerolineae bacterium]|nr:hypothetical protein [Anaerolineae bacterium]